MLPLLLRQRPAYLICAYRTSTEEVMQVTEMLDLASSKFAICLQRTEFGKEGNLQVRGSRKVLGWRSRLSPQASLFRVYGYIWNFGL